MRWYFRSFFYFVFSKMLVNHYLAVMITSDVFLYLRIDLFLYAVFKVHAVLSNLVENTRFELVTSCLQGRRSPN